MMGISRTSLFGKLNRLGFQAMENATTFCKMRGNPFVELVHWLHQILNLQDSDLHRIIRHFDLNPANVARDMTEALNRLPMGSTSVQDFSAHVEEAIERGWIYGTLMFGDACVRTGYILVGILETHTLKRVLVGVSDEFAKIGLDTLTAQFNRIVGGSPEEKMAAADGTHLGGETGDAAPGQTPPDPTGQQDALRRFSQDLTEKARQGELDPIVGRDDEIRQIVDILMRRRQNNPILTGEAGVGKTAVVEGFALRIAAGDVPPPLHNISLRVLDVGLLQAGAGYKGEFEKRLRQVIDAVQSSEKPIILFIDEAHTLIGAGGTAGTGDAANLLKPALARGTLRTIGATTWAEYKKYIEKDPALTRRFQVVQIKEPSEEQAILMMRSMASVMERHHRVQLLDEALAASVTLSHRYIPARQLPDKSVSLLDTACARVAISQHAVPARVDDCRRSIQALETELKIIARETTVGIDTDTAEREAEASQKLTDAYDRLERLEQRWHTEKDLVEEILGLRRQLRGIAGRADDLPPDDLSKDDFPPDDFLIDAPQAVEQDSPAAQGQDVDRLRGRLRRLQEQLREIQGEAPLILPTVDAQAVATVVADWTGIPVGRMVKDEIDTVLRLADILNRRILGQRHALEMIAMRIQTSRARLDNPNKPVGVFLLAGPSGVGKTETALALAEALYGGEQNVVTINMSEFQEAHTVSTLKGAPPGYVGYGEGGILTEAVRRKPYSVILLDEVEKAHPDVYEIFFQVFDKGWMEDAEGRFIDFKNTLILLTSNVGTDLIMSMCRDPELMPDPEGLAKACRKPLLEVFPAALLGRLVTIPYYPLADGVLGDIVRLQLARVEQRIYDNHKIPFTFESGVVDQIINRCTEFESGGRMIDSILTNTLLPRISTEILSAMAASKMMTRVHLSVEGGEFAYAFE
jgi:type VI secretion system protein VasG